MRRLFSTFAHGWPGVGLLVMRLVGGTTFAARALGTIESQPFIALPVGLLGVFAGLCLVAGFWTPIAGSVIATIGLWFAFARPEDPLSSVLLATIGGALALLGPGAWSIDARLFGWKRIDVPDRKR